MTIDEMVAAYDVFINSGLSPNEAASMVDGIAALEREQRRASAPNRGRVHEQAGARQPDSAPANTGGQNV